MENQNVDSKNRGDMPIENDNLDNQNVVSNNDCDEDWEDNSNDNEKQATPFEPLVYIFDPRNWDVLDSKMIDVLVMKGPKRDLSIVFKRGIGRGQLTNQGFSDWAHIGGRLREHETDIDLRKQNEENGAKNDKSNLEVGTARRLEMLYPPK
ncbi:uncharacterized protein LOC125492755 [Beta vulgaris subsp. vulgaris]|uniref:uncharacterized protein LOC125492755 n=1 Tax=Beta vulgaris subsp. vulgaris TaxID=3555 RepID=UPI0025492CE3|nr:uncharacterized protein LOC125492755 [Beta vulgaris subsp. vulgaris]